MSTCSKILPIPFEFSMPSTVVDCMSHEEYTVNAESKLTHYSVNDANSTIYHSHIFSTFQVKVIILVTTSQRPFYSKCLPAAS